MTQELAGDLPDQQVRRDRRDRQARHCQMVLRSVITWCGADRHGWLQVKVCVWVRVLEGMAKGSMRLRWGHLQARPRLGMMTSVLLPNPRGALLSMQRGNPCNPRLQTRAL